MKMIDIRQIKSRYQRFENDYRAYSTKRGFTTFNDFRFHLRGFLTCWAAPGIHRFWQIWNPGISFLVYRLYLRMGGKRNQIRATILAFVINGLIHHTVFYLLTGQWSFTIPVVFLFFGITTVISRFLAPVLRQEKWPWLLNLLVNTSYIIFFFHISFKINHYLMGIIL